jgi:hypothetical protein
MNNRPMSPHRGHRRAGHLNLTCVLFCRLSVAVGLFFAPLYLTRHAAAETVANCVNRCEMICGYFPNNPECQRQADRCVVRCKRQKGD